MQEKLAKYDAPQKAKALGVYPYFRKIESDQDTEASPITLKSKKLLLPPFANMVRGVPVLVS